MRAISLCQGAGALGLAGLLVTALGQGRADAVAPPAPGLGSVERARLKERDCWEALALKQERAGKLAEALEAAGKVLAIERALFGDVHEDVAGSLGGLGWLHEAREDYAAAVKARAEAVTVWERLHGAGHWRTVDARWDLATVQSQTRMGPDRRRALQRARQLNREVVRLYAWGKPVEVLKLAQEARELFKVSLGEGHPAYATSLNNLANLYRRTGEHARALALQERALAIHKAGPGDKHPEYAASLHNLAALYDSRGEYAKALPLYEQARSVWKASLGEKHPRYAASLNNLALLYKSGGDYGQALPLYEQARDICKATLGEGHPLYVTSLDNLAGLYKSMGEYAKALPLSERARDICKASLGERHPLYATSLHSLASLYKSMGEYAKALSLLERACELRKASLGERHPSYAVSLNNLAGLYESMGEYAKALPLYERARDICKAALGEKHPHYATSLNNLALLYKSRGEYAKALPLYEQARDLIKASQGEGRPSYATSLNNLAALYESMGEHARALPLFERARDLRKAGLGDKHPSYAASLNNLAALYRAVGDHARALPLYERARDLRKASLGERHPEYAASLHNLASLYRDIGDHAKALPLLERARDIFKATLGEGHPHYAKSLENLAVLHRDRGEDGLAAAALEQSLALQRGHLGRTALSLSQRQHLALIGQLRGPTDLLLSLSRSAVGDAEAYAHLLTARGAVLAQQRLRRDFQRLAAHSKDGEVARLIQGLQASSAELTALAFAPVKRPETYRRRVTELSLLIEKQEVELARRSADFESARDRFRATPAGLQKALPAGVALVDFREYTYCPSATKEKGARPERRLAAFVIRPESLARVELGAAAPIAADIAAWRARAGSRRRPSYGAGDPAQRLRDRLWAPLLPHLKGARTVLLSPDGELTGLPFAALPGSDPGRYLVEEEVALGYMAVPQLLPDLLGRQRPAEGAAAPALLLVGDVDYGEPGEGGDRGIGPTRRLGALERLDASRQEVAAIKDTFSRRFRKGQVTDLREDEPTVAVVREKAPRHDYLHLATHGFFADRGVRSALEPAKVGRAGEDLFGRRGVAGWHPGLLSGVVLAGANRAGAAGVLTALDVAELDLDRAELVVLSACETGLGARAGGEGVLGLQRAFQVAGARSVVASLWKVEDEPTRALMVAFYEKLWDRKKPLSRVEALRQAQLLLLRGGRGRPAVREDGEEHRGQAGRLPPLYWAGFVLSGDWGPAPGGAFPGGH